MHNTKTPNERLFAGKLDSLFTWYLTKNGINKSCYKYSPISKKDKRKIGHNVQRIHQPGMHVCKK